MLCVVDCDPHGIDIMRMYKHGSRGLGHEANARVPGLQWLGIKMDDILVGVNQPRLGQGSSQGTSSQGSHSPVVPASQSSTQFRSQGQRTATDSLMALTPNDRKTARRILKAIAGEEGGDERELDQEELEQLRELQVMLMLNMKAEIQAIDNMGDLSGWLDEKMDP